MKMTQDDVTEITDAPAPENRVTDKELGAKELAVKMLEWGELQEKANKLAEEIKAAVLISGKTQTVGNVRASYSNPRGRYDYQKAVEESGIDIDSDFADRYIKIDYHWKDMCEAAGIDVSGYYKQTSSQKVTLKLV